MQLRHLKTFAAVASTLNMTRAAERVHLAQSSVTEQIQALEADLGAPLFDRSRRTLRLTEAGRTLLAYSQDLLALADEARAAVAHAAGAATGTLNIGGLETLCGNRLTPILAGFAKAHPAISLKLKVASSGELRDAVRAGAMDVCFAFGASEQDTDLQTEDVAEEPLVVIAPSRHSLAGAASVPPAHWAGEAFLVTENGCVYRRMFEDAFPPGSPGRPRIAGQFDSMATIRALVAAGLGCALVPESVAGKSADDRAENRAKDRAKNSANNRANNRAGNSANNGADTFAVFAWEGERRAIPITMKWRTRRVQPPALQLFLDAVREHFRRCAGAGSDTAPCGTARGFTDATPADGRHPHAARSL
jgi:DNA-binding transcriptional LysR family regulator